MGNEHDTSAHGGLGARLAAARHAAFVGRAAELELFRSALAQDPPPFAVLHVHGPGGIGKSSLLTQYARLAREVGRRVVPLDGREVDASPEGARAGLADALGSPPDDVVDVLAAGPSPVLLLDTYELLSPIDRWLREDLLPRLPESTLVVVASREPPTAGWRADVAWSDLLRVVALRDLRAEEARALLAARGVDDGTLDAVTALVRGHPLGLVLVAEVLRDGAVDTELASLQDAPEVIEPLLRRFLRQVPGARHRRALHAAALAGVATEALLRDLLDGEVREVFDWLRGLSFVQPVTEGVAVHDLAAATINAELRWRDDDAWTELHAAVTRHVERRIGRASGVEQHRRLVDLLRLYRHHPVTRRFFEIERDDDRWLEPAAPRDHDAILSLVRLHEGPASAEVTAWWLRQQPGGFWTIRRRGEDSPVGFVSSLLLRGGPGDEADADPVMARVWEHVRSHGPLRSGEGVRVVRHWVMREGHQPVDAHHLVSARAAIDWSTTPDLAWAVATIVETDRYAPIFEFMDFARVAGEVALGDATYGGFARDMRVMSLRTWLDLLRDRRAGLDDGPDGQPPRPAERLLVLAQDDFAEAVRDALRGLARPGGLAGNPLLRSRVVVEHAGDGPREAALAALLEEVTEELADHPRDARLRRALVATYLSPAPTQEAAAERLDLPYSTFRRHLSRGVDHVIGRLWDLELHGAG